MIPVHAAVSAPMAEQVNLAGGWGQFWSAITGGFPKITMIMTIIGVILVVFAIVKWAWDRRRGGLTGNHGHLWGSLIPGAVLVAPTVLLPLGLLLLDGIINMVISIIQSAAGG